MHTYLYTYVHSLANRPDPVTRFRYNSAYTYTTSTLPIGTMPFLTRQVTERKARFGLCWNQAGVREDSR